MIWLLLLSAAMNVVSGLALRKLRLQLESMRAPRLGEVRR